MHTFVTTDVIGTAALLMQSSPCPKVTTISDALAGLLIAVTSKLEALL